MGSDQIRDTYEDKRYDWPGFPGFNRRQTDLERAMRPRAGDWWHDHYCPHCLVLGVTAESVIITKKIEVNPFSGQWMWPENVVDEDKITMSRSEFVASLSYSTMPGKLWASSVRPSQEQ